jgi:hypothetical protein
MQAGVFQRHSRRRLADQTAWLALQPQSEIRSSRNWKARAVTLVSACRFEAMRVFLAIVDSGSLSVRAFLDLAAARLRKQLR